MLLALLFLIILSTKTGISILVKSIFVLVLGPPNLELFFQSENNVTNISDVSSLFDNSTMSSDTCDYTNVNGTYKFESSSNFDNYMKALGIGFIMRQLASLAQPVVTLSIECADEANITKVSS